MKLKMVLVNNVKWHWRIINDCYEMLMILLTGSNELILLWWKLQWRIWYCYSIINGVLMSNDCVILLLMKKRGVSIESNY